MKTLLGRVILYVVLLLFATLSFASDEIRLFYNDEVSFLDIHSDFLKADTVEWALSDASGTVVKKGISPVKNASFTVTPEISRNGYYVLKAEGRQMASFAIISRPVYNVDKSPFMVQTHFAQGWNTNLIPLLHKAGIGMIRDELYWKDVETRKDIYNFSGRFDNYMKALKENKMSPLIIMTYENPLYDKGLTPYTDVGRNAYAEYGKGILDKYNGQVRYIEVWNEYNGTWCKGPAAENRPLFYTEMLKTVYNSVKKSHPDVKILGSAVVEMPPAYLEGLFKNNALKYMDIFVIHPYNQDFPECCGPSVDYLHSLMNKYDNGQLKPIWATEAGFWSKDEYDHENGFATYEKGRCKNAVYFARRAIVMLSRGVEKINCYLARDYNEFNTMGVFRDENAPEGRYAPTPLCPVIANLSNIFTGAVYLRTLIPEDNRSGIYIYTFNSNNEKITAMWTAYEKASIELKYKGKLRQIDLYGNYEDIISNKNNIRISLSEEPLFIKGEIESAVEIPGINPVISDSFKDFSGEQGFRNWHYGYCFKNDVSDFKDMKYEMQTWEFKWTGPAPFLCIGSGGFEPSYTGDNKKIMPVFRWISPLNGEITVKGYFKSEQKEGDGTVNYILHNGKELFQKHIHNSRESFNIIIPVTKGDRIDFLSETVKPTFFYGTGFHVLILENQEEKK